LLLAGASLACSYVLYAEAFGGHMTRVPLWVLALSVGLIASVGGSASLLVGDYSGDDWRAEAEASEQYVVVERSQWLAIQDLLHTATPAALRGGSRTVASGVREAPEWAEPLLPSAPIGRLGPGPVAPEGPPAPMGITHGIESLATEVERMVADLETAVDASAGTPSPAPKPPTTPAPAADRSPGAEATGPQRPSGPSAVAPARPASSASEPSARSPTRPPLTRPPNRPISHVPAKSRLPPPTPPTTDLESEADVAAEHRALLEELEHRAALALGSGALPSPSAAASGPRLERCVGCDAKLAPSERSNVCRSCGSAMCASCRDRSAKEGFAGLCALCSILEQSAGRDGRERR
ncbi:MAG TPA: FYVE zinc finger domain-containing protein, partial [Thermoplasmata archaeon]|nr:FYVE zinc finger domain-containing protein [Thermoplasmata archaeon]